MKNLKKLNRNELKTIDGNGLLGGLLGGIVGSGGVIIGIIKTADGIIDNAVGTVDNTICQVQCLINGVVVIKPLNCSATTC
ncbi:bacteriocin-like protein [Chryseobacterium sp. JUb7]|uniref:bacteriocin-like protein n=1 Tax=Chryseobacterium sp. JUb7 TaxID=2940599 RepID=UPI0021675FCE|nr:hypothetical protein [Chryseobacterium sp. JUb7]MCS3528922.1 hypothetical protein [Chryseobacterium sp. JUb7]